MGEKGFHLSAFFNDFLEQKNHSFSAVIERRMVERAQNKRERSFVGE